MAKLHIEIKLAAHLTMTAWARYHFASVLSLGSYSHLGTGGNNH